MRARILDTAYRILEEEGVEALTTRRVCEAVDVTVPTLYHYFGSRDGLVQAVYAAAMQEFMASKRRLALTEDPVHDLRAGCDLVLDFAAKHRNVTTAVLARGVQEPQMFSASYELLRERVARVAASRTLKLSESHIALAIWSVVNGLAFATVARPMSQGALPTAVRQAALNGLFAELF